MADVILRSELIEALMNTHDKIRDGVNNRRASRTYPPAVVNEDDVQEVVAVAFLELVDELRR